MVLYRKSFLLLCFFGYGKSSESSRQKEKTPCTHHVASWRPVTRNETNQFVQPNSNLIHCRKMHLNSLNIRQTTFHVHNGIFFNNIFVDQLIINCSTFFKNIISFEGLLKTSVISVS